MQLRIVFLLASSAALLALSAGSAVHEDPPGLFEIDQDAADSVAIGEDWSTVFAGASSADAVVFIGADAEGPAVDTSYFAGGGSKDHRDLDEWNVHGNTAPSKNQIMDAGAAYYETDDGRYLYFFLDRLSVKGDSAAGFWFLQSPVTAGDDGALYDLYGNPAKHTDGDVLVITSFTNGGVVGSVDIYRWDSTTGTVGEPETITDVCGMGGTACAVVNAAGGADPPWDYVTKDKVKGQTETMYPANAFMEGGINYDHFFGTGAVCFSTFIAETRTSQSLDAVLKDIAADPFRNCRANISITPLEAVNPIRATHTFTVSVTRDVGHGDEPVNGQLVTATIHGVGGFYDSDAGTWTAPTAICTTDASGTCQVVGRSDVAGTMTVNATADVDLGSVTVPVTTDGSDGNSDYATKRWDPIDGTVIIRKAAQPADGTDFTFAPSWSDATFQLDVDEDDTLPDSRTFTLERGAYTITEDLLLDWKLTGLTCEETHLQNSGSIGNQATINLEAEETVTCTYTNTKNATISLEKQTLPDGSTQDFTFTGDLSGTITDGGTISRSVVPGTYQATETTVDGWRLTNVECSNAEAEGATATYDVGPGETAHCTFTNVEDSTIIVRKVADPDDGTDFSFSSDFSDSFQLDTDAGSETPDHATFRVNPGDHWVTESLPAFWSLVGVTCTPTQTSIDNGVAISVGPGETADCTFSNQKRVDTTTTTEPTRSSITLGASIQDTATVTGTDGQAPADGTVTFFVCGPNELTITDAGAVCGFEDGSQVGAPIGLTDGKATSSSFAPTAAGTWCFRAEYSGSSNGVYGPSRENAGTECFTVERASPTLTTTPSSTSISIGDSLTDGAVIEGAGDGFPTPTGSITFYVCAPAELVDGVCEDGTSVGDDDLVQGSATSPPFTPDHTGTWCFRATYPGDDNYLSTSENAATECFSVGGIEPTLTTEPSEASLELGGSLTDGATITGLGGDFPEPTGSITFYVCAPAELVDGVCKDGTSIGTGEISNGAATSPEFTPDRTGTWCFRATYPGDDNYLSTSENAVTECFEVTKTDVTLTTLPSHEAIVLGGQVTDVATITGLGEGFPEPTGSITFYVCGEAGLDDGRCVTGTLVGDGAISEGKATSPAFTPDATGPWCFRATYPGDDNYRPAKENATTECFLVITPPELIITKSSDAEDTKVGEGGSVSYVITYENVGGSEANEVTIRDEIPAGTAFVSCDTCSFADGTATWTVGTVEPEGSGAVSITVSAEGADGVCQVCNTANITAEDRNGATVGPITSEGVCFCMAYASDPESGAASGAAHALAVRVDLAGVDRQLMISSSAQNGPGSSRDDDEVDSGTIDADIVSVSYGLLTSSSSSRVSGFGAEQRSVSRVADLEVLVSDALAIEVDVITAIASAEASGGHAAGSTDGSTITGLVVNGVAYGDLLPGTVVPLDAGLFGEGSHLTVFGRSIQEDVPTGDFGGTYHASASTVMLSIMLTDPLGLGTVAIDIAAAAADASFAQTGVCELRPDAEVLADADVATIDLDVAGIVVASDIGHTEIPANGGQDHVAGGISDLTATDVVGIQFVEAHAASSDSIGTITDSAAHAYAEAQIAEACLLRQPDGCVVYAEGVRAWVDSDGGPGVHIAHLEVQGVTQDLCGDAGMDPDCTPPHSEIDVLGFGVLHINEQVDTGQGWLVQALRFDLDTGVINGPIVIAQAHAWARWAPDPTPPAEACLVCEDEAGNAGSAEGDALRVILPSGQDIHEGHAAVHAAGADDEYLTNAWIPEVETTVVTAASHAETSWTPLASVSEATVRIEDACLLDCLVSVEVLEVSSISRDGAFGRSREAAVTIAGLGIAGVTDDLCGFLGLDATCTPPPNTAIGIPAVGTLHLNVQLPFSSEACEGQLVRGLWLEVDLLGADVILAEATTQACWTPGIDCDAEQPELAEVPSLEGTDAAPDSPIGLASLLGLSQLPVTLPAGLDGTVDFVARPVDDLWLTVEQLLGLDLP